LKKNTTFKWTEECEVAFNALKIALISPPVLRFPDFSKDFIVYTDASKFSIGYILGQRDEEGKEHVIAYGGRSIHKNEVAWSITELECLALVEGIKHFHVYLTNSRVVVYTDHISLKYLESMQCKTGRLLRWAMLLQPYNLDIQHKPGKQHGNADALSRRTYEQPAVETPEDIQWESAPGTLHTEECNHIQTATVSILEKLAKAETAYLEMEPLEALQEIMMVSVDTMRVAQQEDKQLALYIKFLEDDELPEDKRLASRIRDEQLSYQMTDGILYHLYSPRGKGSKATREVKQLCVPHKMRDDLLRSYHDSLGHQGQDRTQRAVGTKYFWPRMQTDIEYYVKSCEECQKSKRNYHGKHAPLQPLHIGHIFSRIHVDMIGPLNKTPEGYQHILLVMDSFTKWCEAFPMKSGTAADVAEVLHSEIFCRYGAPREMLTDRGQNFSSHLVAELCKLFQVTKLQTSSYHPQTNAACERMNRFIEKTLKPYMNKEKNNWHKVLPSVLWAYRTTPATESTGYSPFYMMFVREPTQPIDVELLPATKLTKDAKLYMEELKRKMTISHTIARDNISAAQLKYSHQHNKTSAPPKFKEDDIVWMFCSKTPTGVSPKLCQKWLGPYYICVVHETYTYKLRRVSDNKLVKSVIHADRLKLYTDPADRPTNPPEGHLDDTDDLDPEEFEDELRANSDEQTGRADQSKQTHLQQAPTTSQETQNDNQQSDEQMKKKQSPEQSTSKEKKTGQKSNEKQGQDEPSQRKSPADNITKILQRKWYNKRQCYRVHIANQTKSVWLYEEDIPGNMIRKFFAEKTASGRSRRKPFKQPSKQEQSVEKQAPIELAKDMCRKR
jgi:transposase InsO family protein